MTGKQLRNSILQWAIQGKLVSQDPNDEPASVLLQRIREEKSHLVKEGKIKRDKNETIIYRGDDNSYYEKTLATGAVRCIDDEIPFEIPNSWEWCRMGRIGDWGAGATPSKSNPHYYGGKILWLRTGELNDSYVYDTEIKITELALKECSLRENRIGDVLIAMYGATIGKVAIAGANLTTNQACCACTPIIINNEFLFYYLMGCKTELTQKGEGGAQPNISREKLMSHLMPIPPIEEQKRIVKKIKSVLSHIYEYENNKILLDKLNGEIANNLKKSILQEAIQGRLCPQLEAEGTAEELLDEIRTEKERLVKEGKLKKSALAPGSRIFRADDNKYYEQIGKGTLDITEDLPFDIPSTWCWVRLPHIGMSELGKTLDKGKDSGTLTPYLCSINVYWNGLNFSNIKTALFNENEHNKYKLEYGDLLVCEGGDVGRCAIWKDTRDMWFQNALHRIRLYGDIDPRFIKIIIEAYKHIGLIDAVCKGVTIKHFTQKALHSLYLPLPPIAEQQRILSCYHKLCQQMV